MGRIGLLTWVLWSALTGAVVAGEPAEAGEAPAGYAALLGKYVVGDEVDYAAWAADEADQAALDAVMEAFARTDPGALDRAAQTAFYINLYNAAMLDVVFDHYPVDSVRDIGPEPFSVFKEKFIRHGDRRLSLDEVEKEILLGEYFDPRIHFAVNCASESCPPLRAEPYTGARLEAQLDEQTRLFAGSGRAARVDREAGTTAFSELFKWYAGDFGVDHPAAYLNRYRATLLPEDHAVEWIKYDWSLNAANR